MQGYADVGLDVKTARYGKGGALKLPGLFLALGITVATAGKWNGWW